MTSAGRGQAAIEYVLLLVLIVAIASAFMAYSRSMQTFLGAYFEYFECLIVAGELPDNDEGTCTFPTFQPTSMALGGPREGPGTSSGSGSGGNNGGASGGTDSGGSNSSNSGSGSTSGNGADGGADGDGDGPNGGRNSNNARNRDYSSPPREALSEPNSQSTLDESGRDANGRTTNNADNNSDSFGDGRSRTVPFGRNERSGGRNRNLGKDDGSAKAGTYSDFTSGRPRNLPISSAFEETLAVARLRADRVPATEAGLLAEQRRAAGIPVGEREIAKADDEKTEFTLGDWLRYVIIAGIVIAILVFFGLQIQQFRKSRSK